MAHFAHNFFPPGMFALGFFQDDDTRHEVYSRPTKTGTDTLVGVLWPADISGAGGEMLITGADDSEQYVYARAFTACNVRDNESELTKLRRVAFDGDGNLITPVPNAPVGRVLTLGPGGLITLTWSYNALAQEVAPATFRVYIDAGLGFDFDAPDAIVAATGGIGYSSQATFAHGTATSWIVRSVSADGAEETNAIEVSATADAQAPNAPGSVLAEVV